MLACFACSAQTGPPSTDMDTAEEMNTDEPPITQENHSPKAEATDNQSPQNESAVADQPTEDAADTPAPKEEEASPNVDESQPQSESETVENKEEVAAADEKEENVETAESEQVQQDQPEPAGDSDPAADTEDNANDVAEPEPEPEAEPEPEPEAEPETVIEPEPESEPEPAEDVKEEETGDSGGDDMTAILKQKDEEIATLKEEKSALESANVAQQQTIDELKEVKMYSLYFTVISVHDRISKMNVFPFQSNAEQLAVIKDLRTRLAAAESVESKEAETKHPKKSGKSEKGHKKKGDKGKKKKEGGKGGGKHGGKIKAESSDLTKWMEENEVFDEQLYSVLVTHKVSTLAQLTAMKQGKFDKLLRVARTEMVAKFTLKKDQKTHDKILVKFEKAWRKKTHHKKGKNHKK